MWWRRIAQDIRVAVCSRSPSVPDPGEDAESQKNSQLDMTRELCSLQTCMQGLLDFEGATEAEAHSHLRQVMCMDNDS